MGCQIQLGPLARLESGRATPDRKLGHRETAAVGSRELCPGWSCAESIYPRGRTEAVALTIDGSLAVVDSVALWGRPRLFRHRGSRFLIETRQEMDIIYTHVRITGGM